MISDCPRGSRWQNKCWFVTCCRDEIVGWIAAERSERRLSQREVIIDALAKASGKGNGNGTLLSSTSIPNDSRQPTRTSRRSVLLKYLRSALAAFGVRSAKSNGRCLFSCEWDEHSQKTYKAWYGKKSVGDIRDVTYG